MLGFSLILLAGATNQKINNSNELPSPIYKIAVQKFPSVTPRAAPPAPPVPPPASPPPPPPPVGPSQSAIPKGNPDNWVTIYDYPIEAISEKREGIAGFRLEIGRDGRVKSCVINSTSGHADFDLLTCKLITRRARFSPALSKGEVVEGSYSNRVRWQAPDINEINNRYKYTIQPSSSVAVRYEVTADGKMISCTVSSNLQQNAENVCDSKKLFKPYLDSNGKPRHVQVVIYNSVNVSVVDKDEADVSPNIKSK